LKVINNSREIQGDVRFVDNDGVATVMTGVLAMSKAEVIGLDLVMVSSGTVPVVKIMDYKKHLYDIQKNLKEQKRANKKRNNNQLKEIKFHVNIGDNDYNIKVKHIEKFIGKRYKVRVTVALRGREMAHQDLAKDLIHKVIGHFKDLAKTEKTPIFQGRNISTILIPN
jgi:translation initiation factor IF-3